MRILTSFYAAALCHPGRSDFAATIDSPLMKGLTERKTIREFNASSEQLGALRKSQDGGTKNDGKDPPAVVTSLEHRLIGN